VAWYVFSNEHTGPTLTEVLPPDCGEVPPLFSAGLAPADWLALLPIAA
jgi:hypothetical protein